MEKVYPRFLPAGDTALVVEFGERIDPAINRRVHALKERIRQSGLEVVELVPTYRSLLVLYDPWQQAYEALVETLAEMVESLADAPLRNSAVIEIPTVYGGTYGPDLEDLARQHGLSPDEVVRIHSEKEYLVYMVGFTPGFPYLGEVDERIATPRLQTPRTHVPAGSVGIAGRQTGIYPLESPGGWQLIGYTPVRLFDPQHNPPARVGPGCRVRFMPIREEDLPYVAANP